MCDKQFTSKSLQSLYCKDSFDTIKTIRSLILIIDKQQEDIRQLKKWIRPRREKLNVLQWLNESYPGDLHFSDWVQRITVNRQDLRYIFEHNLVNGIFNIFLNHMHNDIPIRCFSQKMNTFYVRNDTWKELSHDQFSKILQTIHQKILQEFKQWQDENYDLIFDQRRNDLYHTYIKKVMGPTNYKRVIRSKLFKRLQFNLRNIVIYNFTF